MEVATGPLIRDLIYEAFPLSQGATRGVVVGPG